MDWIRDALREHPEVALFLTLAAGHWVGRLRIKSFKLGAVVGCLLVGVAMGQLGVTMPGIVGSIFFLLFLFSVGYKTGPQFFGSLGKNAVVPIFLTVLFSLIGVFTAYALARIFNFDTGTATGLFSGGLQSSEAMGTGTVAIARLAIPEDLRRTFTANVTVGYAVTYLVAMFTGIFFLIQVGRGCQDHLRAACRELEEELGMRQQEVGVEFGLQAIRDACLQVPDGSKRQLLNWRTRFRRSVCSSKEPGPKAPLLTANRTFAFAEVISWCSRAVPECSEG